MRFAFSVAGALLAAQALSSPLLVGLWDFPAVQPDDAFADLTASVHAEPLASTPVIARLDARGITSGGASTYLCMWGRDLERLTMPRGCRLAESGYEIPAVAVFDRRGDWLRIAIDDTGTRLGWVQARGGFHALVDLLASDELTYLTTRWDGLMYEAPGGPRSRPAQRSGTAASARGETPYRSIGHTFIANRLWLHIELLDAVCSAAEPKVVDSGWLPAQAPAGEQWAWFWSRGC